MSDSNFVRPHYYGGSENPLEARKVIRHHGLNFNLGSVLKYVLRSGKKDGEAAIKDLIKAKTFIEFEIEALQNTTNTDAAGNNL